LQTDAVFARCLKCLPHADIFKVFVRHGSIRDCNAGYGPALV
jgi:hypothetical protein